jgi:hypothetical protein
MPTSNGNTVPYGQDSIVPTTALAAWGARLIVDQDGYVDFVHDRTGCAGEDRETIINTLCEELPLHPYKPGSLIERISDLLRRGEMQTREVHDFLIHDSDKIEVHANTNASAGYCYVTAWLKPDEAQGGQQ